MRSKRKRMKRRRRKNRREKRRRSKLEPSAFWGEIPPTLPDISPLAAGEPLAVGPLEYSEHLSTSPVMLIKRWTPWLGDSRARQIQGWLNTCPGGCSGGIVPATVWSPLPLEAESPVQLRVSFISDNTDDVPVSLTGDVRCKGLRPRPLGKKLCLQRLID